MRAVHKGLKGKRFEKPTGVVSARICLDSGCVATESCERTESEYFAKGTVPGACQGHTKLKICKESEKIANDYCPETEEKTYLVKPAKENTSLWSTNAGDKYNIPEDKCDIHKEPEKVVLPSVVGKKMADAVKTLEGLGLKAEIKYDEDKKKDDGVVLKQSKDDGTKVEKGTTITLTINKKTATPTPTPTPKPTPTPTPKPTPTPTPTSQPTPTQQGQ